MHWHYTHNKCYAGFDPTLTVPEHIAGVADGRIVVISVCYAQATARPSEKP